MQFTLNRISKFEDTFWQQMGCLLQIVERREGIKSEETKKDRPQTCRSVRIHEYTPRPTPRSSEVRHLTGERNVRRPGQQARIPECRAAPPGAPRPLAQPTRSVSFIATSYYDYTTFAKAMRGRDPQRHPAAASRTNPTLHYTHKRNRKTLSMFAIFITLSTPSTRELLLPTAGSSGL